MEHCAAISVDGWQITVPIIKFTKKSFLFLVFPHTNLKGENNFIVMLSEKKGKKISINYFDQLSVRPESRETKPISSQAQTDDDHKYKQ